MVSRYREELGHGQEPARAVVRSVQTAGRTIVFSGATVMAALAVLLIFPLYFLRSFAYAGIGVVLISMAAAVVVLPALLAVLGRRVNSGRLPWARHREESGTLASREAGRMAMRQPEPSVPLTIQGLGAKLDRMAAAQATDGVKLDQLVTDQAAHTDLLRRLATVQEQQADLLAGQARQLDEHTERLAKLDRVQDTQVELLRELVRAVRDMRQ